MIGLSTYTFNNHHDKVVNWQQFISQHVLPNDSQWEDFGYDKLMPHMVKRYSIATQWSVVCRPSILGKKECSVDTISDFLAFFPTAQSIIYMIVELIIEELPIHCSFDGSGKGKNQRVKEKKLPASNKLKENKKVKVEENMIRVKEEDCLDLKHTSGIYENDRIEGTKVIKLETIRVSDY